MPFVARVLLSETGNDNKLFHRRSPGPIQSYTLDENLHVIKAADSGAWSPVTGVPVTFARYLQRRWGRCYFGADFCEAL